MIEALQFELILLEHISFKRDLERTLDEKVKGSNTAGDKKQLITMLDKQNLVLT